MKPFGALYFCIKNKNKILTVILMIVLTGLLYVGGSYLTNIQIESLNSERPYKDFTLFFCWNDSDGETTEELLTEVEKDNRLHLIQFGSNNFRFPTTLGFTNGNNAAGFLPEDFAFINNRLHLVKDESLVKDNTVIFSKREAKYLGLLNEKQFKENREEALFYQGKRPYDIVLTDLDCFFSCLISEDVITESNYIVTFETKADMEYYEEWSDNAMKKYKSLKPSNGKSREKNTRGYFVVNEIIFLSIITVVTCVFFITINAVLVGIYDTRKREFILFQRIGISRKRIYKKIICELSLISLTGLVIGFLFSIGIISILNRVVYSDVGLRLRYVHPWSVYSFLICNAMILFPSILLRIRSVKRTGDGDF